MKDKLAQLLLGLVLDYLKRNPELLDGLIAELAKRIPGKLDDSVLGVLRKLFF